VLPLEVLVVPLLVVPLLVVEPLLVALDPLLVVVGPPVVEPPAVPDPSPLPAQPASTATPIAARNAACRRTPNRSLESAAGRARPVGEHLFNDMDHPPRATAQTVCS
jgi:hypothetical protein